MTLAAQMDSCNSSGDTRLPPVVGRATCARRSRQLVFARRVDRLGTAFELVLRSQVADRAVQPHVVVFADIVGNQATGISERDGALRADAFALERLVPALQLAVALGAEWRGTHMGHAHQADVLLEVLGDELRAVCRR